MKERPIIFTGESVRAILAGTKTQTRRVVRGTVVHVGGKPGPYSECPYGLPGDRLWVREAWGPSFAYDDDSRGTGYVYRATNNGPDPLRWRLAIHMPRAASRLLLDVTAVRAERLQAITQADAKAEGVAPVEGVSRGDVLSALGTDATPALRLDYLTPFAAVWDRLNAKRGYPWASDPWVFVIEFRRVEENR